MDGQLFCATNPVGLTMHWRWMDSCSVQPFLLASPCIIDGQLRVIHELGSMACAHKHHAITEDAAFQQAARLRGDVTLTLLCKTVVVKRPKQRESEKVQLNTPAQPFWTCNPSCVYLYNLVESM
eukprot:scaffold10199_cov28-Tisochrysis_lutea.AAC.1